MKNKPKKKSFIRKYKNLGYALAIFVYIDLSLAAFAYVGKNVYSDYQIKEAAESILDTPDLTGMEELELAVEADLAELERKYKPKNS